MNAYSKFAVGARSPERDTDAKEVCDYSKPVAEIGHTHIAHLLEHNEKLITWTGIKGLAFGKGTHNPA